MTWSEFFLNHAHKVIILYIFLRHCVKDITGWIDDLRKAGKFIERRHKEMLNLTVLENLPKDLALLATIVPKIEAAIPLIQKNAADISQALADQKNPAALVADVNALLTDFSSDLAALSELLPKATPTPAVPPVAALP